jgi:molybdenum cofactor cytidylyltransferase
MLDPKREHPRIAAVVLAAGMSTRMGANKLLAEIAGEPLVRRVVRSAETSLARPVVVVTGYEHERVGAAVASAECTLVHNPAFRDGLSTSLSTGIRAVAGCDGAIILLGDMPAISSSLIDRMISAFNPRDGRAICLATFNGRRGNPVLFDRSFFTELQAISGDMGARQIIEDNHKLVCTIEGNNDAPLVDIDTPEALARFVDRL